MHVRKFSVFDAVSYGFKSVVDTIGLFFLVGLTVALSVIVAMYIAAMINLHAVKEIMKIIYATKECATTECLMLVKSMLLPIFKENMFPFLLTLLFLYLIFAAFYAGYQKVMLEFYDNNASHVMEVFSGFKYLHKIAPALFLYLFMVLAGLILILPGIYFGLRFVFFSYFIVDKNSGIFESFKQSWQITRGQMWQVFSLALVQAGLVSINGALIILIWPTMALAYVFAYRNLTA